MRPICSKCGIDSAAVNYKRQGKTYYRRLCYRCDQQPKNARIKSWEKSGYKKKAICEKCGFKAKHPDQLLVFHLNGRLEDCRLVNLKTICANCAQIVGRENATWRQGDLIPDHS